MAKSKQVVIELHEHESLNATDVQPTVESRKISEKTIKKIAFDGLIVGLVIFALFTIIPILQLYIGNRYANQCPANSHIPQYLIVAGVFTLIAIILGFIQIGLITKAAADVVLAAEDNTNKADPTNKLIGTGVAVCCITLVFTVLAFFLFIWFIIGCIWVFSVWNTVQYVDRKQENYCHPVLYRFAFWILFISLFFQILSFCRASLGRST